MQYLALAVWICLALSLPARSEPCDQPDFASLQQAVVQVQFDLLHPPPDGASSVSGTAWFISERHLVTVEHVTENVFLGDFWRPITIKFPLHSQVRESIDGRLSTWARYHGMVVNGMFERLLIIELADSLPQFRVLRVRKEWPQSGEVVVGVGYRGTDDTLQYVYGHYHSYSYEDGESLLNFELTNDLGQDRFAFLYGSSGSPLFDCSGRVVAIVNQVRYEHKTESLIDLLTMQTFKVRRRVPTEPGSPTNTAVPASDLLSQFRE